MFSSNSQHHVIAGVRPIPVVIRADESVATAIPVRQAAFRIDPLTEERWDAFVSSHPQSSVFHSTPWLKALNKTYGYRVVAYTTSAPTEPIKNAIVFCQIDSWLTGRRLVSLPFSDHCQSLVDNVEDMQALMTALEQDVRKEEWRYVETRPLTPMNVTTNFHRSTTTYSFHTLDLSPDIQTLFCNLHKDSIQRKVRRAERENLRYEEGRSEKLLDIFYELLTMTRRRHHLPPQPKVWFENLMNCLGDDIKIRVASKDGEPLAAMMTVRHKDTLMYKYGGSDLRHHRLGPMHLLYWASIQDAKSCGLRYFDLGRTDAGQDGLTIFKSRWGAQQTTLIYTRYAFSKNLGHMFDLAPKSKKNLGRKILAHMPNGVASMLGRALYKHVG
jgi:CelD/BcsL family acetyltransferase involved in cellulose biosynthesis